MAQPRIIVLSGYGINCEEETALAFELAGGKAEILHINEIIKQPKKLSQYQILAIPGGFSYGDHTGSGNAYAWKLRNHLFDFLIQFIEKDRLVIGICNGFQILVNLGLLPAINNHYGKREAALIHNDGGLYLDRWVDLEIKNNTPWLKGIDKIFLPIAHGEGKFYAPLKIISHLDKKKLIAATYVKGEICYYQSLKPNPNGSLKDIAAITNENKKILGMMPHPERAIFFTQLPHWPYLKEKLLRVNKKIPQFGPGLKIFKNGIKYFL